MILLELCENSFIRKTRIKCSILTFKRVKTRGRLARNARFGASKAQDGRSFSRFAWQAHTLEACRDQHVVFAWQAQNFLLMHFGVAWQAQHFVTCPKCFFNIF